MQSNLRDPVFEVKLHALGVVSVIGILLCHSIGVMATLDLKRNDFATWFYTGATSLRLEGDPYAWSAPEEGLTQYPYPPLTAYICLPFAWMDREAATVAWSAANLLLTAVMAWQMTCLLRADTRPIGWRCARGWVIMAALLAAYPHQYTANWIGQVHNLVAVSFLASWLSLRRGRDIQAGLWLGFAALLKLFPIVFLVVMLAYGRWRAAAVTIAAVFVFTVLTFGETLTFVEHFLLPAADPGILASQHYVSFPAMAERLFAVSDYAIPVAVSRFWRLVFLAATALPIVLLFAVSLLRRWNESLVCAAAACLMLLLTPAAGTYHLNLCLIAALMCYRAILCLSTSAGLHEQNRLAGNRWLLAALLTAVLLTAIPVNYALAHPYRPGWLDPVFELFHTKWGLLLLCPQTYGVLILFGISLTLATRTKLSSSKLEESRPAVP